MKINKKRPDIIVISGPIYIKIFKINFIKIIASYTTIIK